VGRDGRWRPVDPSTLRAEIADSLARNPEAPIREIAREVRASPTTVMNVKRQLGRESSEQGDALDRHYDCGVKIQAAYESVDWRSDSALMAMDMGIQMVEWLETHTITDSEWGTFLDAVPLNRHFSIAGFARFQAESWNRFAKALDESARSRNKIRASHHGSAAG
jgi:hypothetical protein